MFWFGVICGLGGGSVGILLYYLFCKFMEWIDYREVQNQIKRYYADKSKQK